MISGDLQGILSEISRISDDKIKEIEEEAGSKIDKILKEAEDKTKYDKDRIIEKGKQAAEQERQRILADARIRARREMADIKESLIEETLKKAREKLKKFADTNEYTDLLINLVKKSVEITAEEEMELVFNTKDRKEMLSKGIEGEEEKRITISNDTIDCIGGVIVRSKNVIIDNTFESRLERFSNEIRTIVAKILFEG
jgi:V/A-type H+-transporting ATPase subunit E